MDVRIGNSEIFGVELSVEDSISAVKERLWSCGEVRRGMSIAHDSGSLRVGRVVFVI